MKKIILTLAIVLLTLGLSAQKAKKEEIAKTFGNVAVVVDACSYQWDQGQYDYVKSSDEILTSVRTEMFDFVIQMLKEEACNVLNNNQNEYDKIKKTSGYATSEETLNDYYSFLQKQKADYLLVVECSEWVEESQFHTCHVHCDWFDLKNSCVRSTDFKGNRIDEQASNAAVFHKNSKLAIQRKLRQFVRNQIALPFKVASVEGNDVSLVPKGPFVAAREGDVFCLYEVTDRKATISGQQVMFKVPQEIAICRFSSAGKESVTASLPSNVNLTVLDGLWATYSGVAPRNGKIFSYVTFVPLTYRLSKCEGWLAKRVNNVIKTTLCTKNGVSLSLQTGANTSKSVRDNSDSITNYQVVIENFRCESQQVSLEVVIRNSLTNAIVKKIALSDIAFPDLEARVASALDNLFLSPCSVEFTLDNRAIICSEAMMNCPPEAYFKIWKTNLPSGKNLKMNAVPKELPIDLQLVKRCGPMLECVVLGDVEKVSNGMTANDFFGFVTNFGPSENVLLEQNLPTKANPNAKKRM